MNLTTRGFSHMNEYEAAAALGISVEELRALVHQHILHTEGPVVVDRPSGAVFNRSDLVLLRVLANQPVAPVP